MAIFIQAPEEKGSLQPRCPRTHPQHGDHGGVSETAVLILEVVSLGSLVPLADLPQLHSLIWGQERGERQAGCSPTCRLLWDRDSPAVSPAATCWKRLQKMYLSPQHFTPKAPVFLFLPDSCGDGYSRCKEMAGQQNRTIALMES